MKNLKLPHYLLLAYVLFFIVLAIRPYDRAVWFAENLPIVLIVLFLVFTYRWFKFSNTAYILMSFLIFMHTLGGHFTFERVPFDFVTDLFGFSRNHYDRIGHFTVGFYAFPIAEFITRRRLSNSLVLTSLFGIFAIFAVAAGYEIIEWLYAAISAPEQGIAFLGSQGDIWDAQKDMLADGLGAITATLLFVFIQRRREQRPAAEL
jgi:putative membrane protein